MQIYIEYLYHTFYDRKKSRNCVFRLLKPIKSGKRHKHKTKISGFWSILNMF